MGTRARQKKRAATKDLEFPDYGYKIRNGDYILKQPDLDKDDWSNYERLVLGTGMNYRNDAQEGFEK